MTKANMVWTFEQTWPQSREELGRVPRMLWAVLPCISRILSPVVSVTSVLVLLVSKGCSNADAHSTPSLGSSRL
jgi:hypothetical protein